MFPQARGGLDDLHSAVRLVLVNSSRAWSSSGGVVVIERQVEVLRTVAGLWRLRRARTLLDQNPRSMGSPASLGRSCWRSVQIVRFLRFADLQALGGVRLLCRQAIGGG